MALTGLPSNRRTPGTFREFFFGVGPGTSGSERDVLIYANKTSAGTETTNTIGAAVADRADARLRFGARSEAFRMWLLFTAADKSATVRIIAVPEGTGALSRTVTFAAGVATKQTVGVISFQGETAEFLVPLGATAIEQAAAFASAFNAASNGEWMATAAVGGGGSEHIVTVTASQAGVRLLPLMNTSLRFAYRESPTTTATLGAAASAGTDDDFTSAYAAAEAGEFYYQINPKYLTTAPTPTDNGVGEGIAYLRAQNAPIVGKAQTMYFGLTGTQAQATTVATDPDANDPAVFFYHAENSDWTAGMIAAHMCGIKRSAQEEHPSANIIGWRAGANRVMLGPPDPYNKADRPTAQEIEDDLKNGISPIAFDSKGNPYLVRDVTSYTEISAGVKSYNASEGHIPSAIHRTWDEIKARWTALVQPNIAADPLPGTKPVARTSTPVDAKAVAFAVIDDFVSSAPLGKYKGPILSPSPADVQAMKDSVVVTKMAGGFQVQADFLAVEHYIKSEWSVRQTNPAQ